MIHRRPCIAQRGCIRLPFHLLSRGSGLEDRAADAQQQFWTAAAHGVQWAAAELQQLEGTVSLPDLLSPPLSPLPEDEMLQGFAPFANVYRISPAMPSGHDSQTAEVRVSFPPSSLHIRAVMQWNPCRVDILCPYGRAEG